jgi:hypothetical protein
MMLVIANLQLFFIVEPQVLEIRLYPNFQVEFDLMRGTLASLQRIIAPLIQNVPLKDLKDYLRKCYSELKSHLSIAKSADDVIEAIEEKCSIINIAIIENIVNEFKIEGASEPIEHYKQSMEEFCEKQVHQLQIKGPSYSLLTCNTIKFILNWNPAQCTLNAIKEVLAVAFKSYNARIEVLSFNDSHSITIICYAPRYLMDTLLMEAEENINQLKEMGLKHLTIGYYTAYDDTKDKRIAQLEKIVDDLNKVIQKNQQVMITDDEGDIHVSDDQIKESERKEGKLDANKEIRKNLWLENEHLKSKLKSKEGQEQELIKENELLKKKLASTIDKKYEDFSTTLQQALSLPADTETPHG